MEEIKKLKESLIALNKLLEKSLEEKVKELEEISNNKDKYIEIIQSMKEWNERKRNNT